MSITKKIKLNHHNLDILNMEKVATIACISPSPEGLTDCVFNVEMQKQQIQCTDALYYATDNTDNSICVREELFLSQESCQTDKSSSPIVLFSIPNNRSVIEKLEIEIQDWIAVDLKRNNKLIEKQIKLKRLKTHAANQVPIVELKD